MQLKIFTFITINSGVVTDVIQTFNESVALQHEQQWLEARGFMKWEDENLTLEQARALYEIVRYDDEYHIYVHTFDMKISLESIDS